MLKIISQIAHKPKDLKITGAFLFSINCLVTLIQSYCITHESYVIYIVFFMTNFLMIFCINSSAPRTD